MKMDRKLATKTGAELACQGRVLVVDDSRLQRRILCSLLTRMGHRVVEVETAGKALDACREGTISIVVSDWMMPGMNGLEFCLALRGLNLDHYVYFILLTSKSEKGEIAEGLDAGADDFLTKPVNGDELRARIVAGQRILTMQKELRETVSELQGLYDALDHDLIEARKLQRSLIREPSEQPKGANISLFLRSSGRVGGDLVGSYPISPTMVGVYSIDVSGHGVASALLSARLAGYLSATSPDQNIALKKNANGYEAIAPDLAVGRLNELILGEIETEHYFTICLAHMDIATGDATFCQAGHPHPAVQRVDGSVEFVGDGGLPVGLIADASYSVTRINLGQGDRVLLYSDGITECENPKGNFFDEEGLTDALANSASNPKQAFFDILIERLERFAEQAEFGDDVSAALFERLC